jgi:ubiquinone/menaquinone biosynthesis C-methylase UbiE
MNNREAYNTWAKNYDQVNNKTRDLEAIAFRKTMSDLNFTRVLEIGSGTGKNTEWIAPKAKQVVAIDFSVEMINIAKEKIKQQNTVFLQTDITKEWTFTKKKFDLIACSLVLEHIKDLDHIFSQANKVLKKIGLFYIGELHPFKQYQGTKARFETSTGLFELECYIHHISDYFENASRNDFSCIELCEWFDEGDKTIVPRIISFLFQKN